MTTTLPDLTDLAPLDVAGRLGRLASRLAAPPAAAEATASEGDGTAAPAAVDALLVTRLPNVRYLTGFTGSAAMLLVPAANTGAPARFVTDGRYEEQARDQLAAAGVAAEVVIGRTQAEQRELLSLAARPHARIGLEAHGVTWAQQRAMAEWFPAAELVATEEMVEDLRREKDAGEVDRVRAACAIADDAFQSLLPLLGSGVTEAEFALRLEQAMRERGASGNSFDPIIAGGPHAAMPHARPSGRVIERGELVVCDFGCVVDGYCSDMTRTVSVGDPGPEARHLYEVVLESQRAGRAAVAVGVEVSEVDRASRAVIEAAGLGERFVHSTGHGVGLEIHEDPRVAATGRGTLRRRDVVTVEPGVYLPGTGGVRIEDTVVVTDDGALPLTLTPKDLVL